MTIRRSWGVDICTRYQPEHIKAREEILAETKRELERARELRRKQREELAKSAVPATPVVKTVVSPEPPVERRRYQIPSALELWKNFSSVGQTLTTEHLLTKYNIPVDHRDPYVKEIRDKLRLMVRQGYLVKNMDTDSRIGHIRIRNESWTRRF